MTQFQKAVIKAIENRLVDMIDYPDDWDNDDFRKHKRILSKTPAEAMQKIGKLIMQGRELDPSQNFEDPLLGSAIKDSWNDVNWEEVATKLARTICRFLQVAEEQITVARR